MVRCSPLAFLISVTAHWPGLLGGPHPCTVYSLPSRSLTDQPPRPFHEIREPRNSPASSLSSKTPSRTPVPGETREYFTCPPSAITRATHENFLTSPMMNMSYEVLPPTPKLRDLGSMFRWVRTKSIGIVSFTYKSLYTR